MIARISLLFFLLSSMLSSFGVSAATPVATLSPKFQIQKFASCEDLESKLIEIASRYQSRYWYPYDLYARDEEMVRTGPVPPRASLEKAVASPVSNAGANSVGSTPVSTTNTQIIGVDEADTVKTDGNYLYSYSEESREVRIVRTTDLALMKKIKLPDTFSSMQMYLQNDRLILVGQKYTSASSLYTSRWYAPEMKTVISIYRVTDPSAPVLERYHQIDGSYRDSRIVGDTLYFVSSNDFRIPPIYFTQYGKETKGFSKAVTDIGKNFTIRNFVPDIRESVLSKTGRYAQSFRPAVSSCTDITFVLPDSATLAKIDFTPSLVSLSSVSITDATAKMKNELLFGDVSQIHMSKSALYITSSISVQASQSRSACPPGAKCFAPSYETVSQTLVHKYSLSKGGLSYQYSTTVAGNPMTQYSMDEDASGNFRIVTQNYAWSSGQSQNSTELSIISPSGKVIGKLTGIAKGENFQSARFIGDRLYLVTFEQIDPLFVIDVSVAKSPKILGELKIPGYSTYLHPYDSDRLIGIGYDTHTNEWGGTQNGGLKIDLYNVKDVKNPKREQSLVLGDMGSSSEVLTNPRAFVYYKEKNLLLLPATLMKSAGDTNDVYRSSSAFQGIVGVSVLPSAITEKFRVSHITLSADLEKEWKKDCAQYSGAKNSCKKLLDGSEYCGGSYNYVPPYCYAGSTVETYFASQMWNYSRDFITRALYVGDTFYSVAEGGIKSWNFANTASPKASVVFTGTISKPSYPVPMMVR